MLLWSKNYLKKKVLIKSVDDKIEKNFIGKNIPEIIETLKKMLHYF